MADIIKYEFPNKFLFHLSSEFPSEIRNYKLGTVIIEESIGAFTPMMELQVADGTGDLSRRTYISPSNVYRLRLGNDEVSMVNMDFLFSTMTGSNAMEGSMDEMNYNISFIGSSWPEMLKAQWSRSWTNKRLSDVAAILAEEAGLKKSDIEATDLAGDIIQPGWNNAKMINWMSREARSASGGSGYIYATTLDGKFIFKSWDAALNQKSKAAFILATIEHNDAAVKRIKVSQKYIPDLIHGGFGVDNHYYDFESDSFMNKRSKLSEMSVRQFADYCFVSKVHETTPKITWSGRDTNHSHVEHRIIHASQASHSAEIVIKGNVTLHVTDIITLVVPSRHRSDTETIINEQYSGNWMISKVTHIIEPINMTHATRLTIVRSGINETSSKESEFVKTRVGKVVI